jgi:Dyp-type peroxidase family
LAVTKVAVDLTVPLSWKAAVAAGGDPATMLEQLQANILKAHVRDDLSVMFLHFGDQAEAKAFLKALAPLTKSARKHLEEVEAFKTATTPGTPYVGVGLTKTGYAAIGVAPPTDASFQRGMKDPLTRQTLKDPPVSTWEEPYREDIHAVVLIGDARNAGATAKRNEVEALLPDSVTVLGEETGLGRHNDNGDGIEHFGYVDGRSQPLFLIEDIEAERGGTDGTNVWDPAFGLDRVLVQDSAAPDPNLHFGSYFVFRKLEQNVRSFKHSEENLAAELKLEGDDRERAGAMLIGRFEDGTPLTLQSAAGTHSPVMNNFTYASDGDGAKCPFEGHIRKANPRGSGGFEPPDKERKHLMARRGQTYGERSDVPFDDSPPDTRPSGGVGLLFMAFNVEFGAQFEFTQSRWVNFPGFPRVPVGNPAPGLDPVIGQGPRPRPSYSPHWGVNQLQEVDPIAQAVRMRGGEYFFMPSLAFLNGL